MKKAPSFARQRPLVTAAVLFALGLWTGVQGILPLYLPALSLVFSLMFACVFRKHRGFLHGVLAAAFFAGCLFTACLEKKPLPPEGNYTVTGYVSGDVEIRETDGYVHTYLRNVLCVDESGQAFRMRKLYWRMYAEDEELALCHWLEDGARAQFQGELQLPNERVNPHGFDFALYLKTQGVRMCASGMDGLRLTLDADRGFASFVYRLRKALSGHLESIFGKYAAVPRAVLLGEKNQLPDETRKLFSDLGIAHVLAVSGLHVGLLAGFGMTLCKPLHLSPKVKIWILSVLLFSYCALLNFAAPVVRASLLLIGNECRRLVRRFGDPLTMVMAIFLFILLLSPYSLFSVSFQMTFAAVLGMVVLGNVIRRWTEKLPGWFQFLQLDATLSAGIGVMIPLINMFHQISLLGVVVSPLAVLALKWLLPCIIFLMILGAVHMPLAQQIILFLEKIFFFVPDVMRFFAELPFNVINVPSIPWMLALALVAGMFLCSRYTLLFGRRRLLSVVAVLAIGAGAWQLTYIRDVCYIQLSAGQADCAVVTDGRETVVIDAGENGNDLASFLLAEGRSADTLIITHLHSDHAGGLAALMENDVKIGRVLIPAFGTKQQIDPETDVLLSQLKERGIPVEEVKAGDEVLLPRGSIRFVWPVEPRTGQDANTYALASLLELCGVRLLSMSDVPGAYENYAAQRADILKVGHHGSADGTREHFLERVQPQTALITCASGRLLPSANTLDRLSACGADMFRTDETGALMIRIRNGAYFVKPYLK